MVSYVVGFLFSEEQDRVVLVLKNRPKWQAGLYNGVGGKVEPGELFDEAMIREFKEETGVEFQEWDCFGKMKGPGFELALYRAFNTKALEQVSTQTDEEIHVVPVDLNVLRTNSISNVAWLVASALDQDQPRFFQEITYGDEPTGNRSRD